MSSVTAVSVVSCDEVRRESSGDAIIIGARQVGPTIAEAEDRLIDRLGLYVELETDYPPPSDIELRLHSDEHNETLVEHSFPIELDDLDDDEITEALDDDNTRFRGVLLIVINREKIQIGNPGEYSVQIRHSSNDWTTLRSYFFRFRISSEGG